MEIMSRKRRCIGRNVDRSNDRQRNSSMVIYYAEGEKEKEADTEREKKNREIDSLRGRRRRKKIHHSYALYFGTLPMFFHMFKTCNLFYRYNQYCKLTFGPLELEKRKENE